MVEFARRSERFGAYFTGLGEDYEGDSHILTCNRSCHDPAEMSEVPMPAHLLAISHGHDDDYICFDPRRGRTGGEYPLRYWAPGVSSWASYPTFLAYIQRIVDKD